ncbi:Twin-arginine translocation protein TatB [Roseibacterium elongatum DSM 19469]|uniref:Sec-independent protein translocase protein TatB n=1 Tax=Roseicyclus elongatus DSM 19469 TaxID=1294273 RepID=W8RN97_9RHOB|nr:Sec-independent protein translocase protein TatB [Roseibacterium elongatum]AHM02609.1 Twin-arginine translocation protein TatB [Roseibacterium elongatum DSM 19469]
MPDIGWMELLVIGVVALIVVGPKDLPMMFRRLGQITGKVRAMAKDFQRAMDEAADETGMSEINRDLKSAAKFTNPRKMGMDALNEAFEDVDLDPSKYAEGSNTRIIAEKQAARKQELADKAEAARKAREAKVAGIDAAAAEMEADMADPPPRPEPAPAAEVGAAAPAEDPAPGPARTGTDKT